MGVTGDTIFFGKVGSIDFSDKKNKEYYIQKKKININK